MDARGEYAAVIEIGRLKAEQRRLREERDALAAHVERLFEVWDTLTSEDRTDVPTLIQHMDDVFTDGPTTSFARRDARMKSEALEEFRKKHTMPHMQNQWLKNAVAEYRHQAEEKNNG